MAAIQHQFLFSRYRDAYFSERRNVSDKWEHYFDIYDHLLSKFYGRSISYLEIGVQNGGSLETARKLFFPTSKIIGLDIDPKCKRLEETGVANKIVIGSQIADQSIKDILEYCPSLDIIIDDGSHIQAHMIGSFIRLFPSLAENGVYIIEDTHTNHSPDHQESFFGLGLYDYFKGLSERLNLDFIDPELRKTRYKIPREKRQMRTRIPDIFREIFSIEYFDSIIAVKKTKKKEEPFRIQR